ncbi:MAG: hypothetical protein ABSH56_25355 [Bryobacteraceae bacterium]|jgi:hypothetical protein
MKSDLYTKAVFTIIALMLTVIACNLYINPAATASAQGPFAGVQLASDTGELRFFDNRTGDVWEYNAPALPSYPQMTGKYRVVKLGQPLVVTCIGLDNCRGK